ncbi:putative pit accessory protein [Gammaproteobacteria bacterium]
MLHRFFQLLMPREEGFTELFVELSQAMVDATQCLHDLLSQGGPIDLSPLIATEARADQCAERIYRLLNRSFITPFRRGEIRSLVSAMDSVADYAEDVAKRAVVYRIETFTHEMASIAHCATLCAKTIQEIIPLTRAISTNAQTINDLCQRVHQIEDEADNYYLSGLETLFDPALRPADPMLLGYMERLYDLTEEVVDACDDVAKVVGDIVAENS